MSLHCPIHQTTRISIDKIVAVYDASTHARIVCNTDDILTCLTDKQLLC